MGDIGSDTWGASDIVEGETGDKRVGLEEERHWLTNTTFIKESENVLVSVFFSDRL